MEPNEQQQQDITTEQAEGSASQDVASQGDAGIPASEDTALSGNTKVEEQPAGADSVDFPSEPDQSKPDAEQISEPEEIDPTDPRDTVVVGGDVKYFTPDGTEITSQLIDDCMVIVGADPENFAMRMEIRDELVRLGFPETATLFTDADGTTRFGVLPKLGEAQQTATTTPDGEDISEELIDQVIAWHGYSVPDDEADNLRQYIVSGLIHVGVPPAMRAKSAEVVTSDKALVKIDHAANQHLDAITAEINQYGGSLADRINNSVANIRATLV